MVGAGAMGSVYGAMFHDAGHNVTFLEINPEVVAALNEHGLRITRRDGSTDEYAIGATSDPSNLEQADLILFQVKGYATSDAAELVRPLVGSKTILTTLQNGLGNEDVLSNAFPDNPLLLGISVHSVMTIAPGQYHHTGVRETHIGPSLDDWEEQASAVANDLLQSGYDFELGSAAEIHKQVFAKWVLNCGSLPVASLTGLAAEEIKDADTVLRVCDEVTREACLVAAAEGFVLDPEERAAYNRSLFRTAGGKASMLQDIEAGRRTEIDTINGAAIRLGEKHGIPVPLNQTMVALVKGREFAMGIVPK